MKSKHFAAKALLTALLAFTPLAIAQNSSSGREQQEQPDLETQARQLAEQMLEGKQIRIRVYPNYQENPCHYEIISAPLDGLSVNLEAVKDQIERISQAPVPKPDAYQSRTLLAIQVKLYLLKPLNSKPLAIVILASDQQDQTIKAILKDRVQVKWMFDDKPLSIWPNLCYDAATQWWTFHDALGNPMKNADVEIILYLSGGSGPRIRLGQVKLDDQGQTRCIKRMNSSTGFLFIVSHPDYGIASIISSRSTGTEGYKEPYHLPLVHTDSEARANSMQGIVTDNRGVPAPNAIVDYMAVYAAQSGANQPYSTGTIFTDDRGRFALHVPIKQIIDSQSVAAPQIERYRIIIEPPESLNLRRSHGTFNAAASPIKIALEPLNTETYFRKFVFEDHQGEINDPQQLKKITVTIARRDAQPLFYSYDQWKDGGQFPLGQFSAQMTIQDKKQSFNTVEVNSDSPEEITFITGQYTLYQGKVVNGLTGEPMPDTIVIAGSCPIDTIRPISQSHLSNLRATALRDDPNESSVDRLHSTEARVTLTDENGCFEFGFLSGRQADALAPFRAIGENYISFRLERRSQSNDASIIVELPTIDMYPAAIIVAEPNIPVDDIFEKVCMSWKVSPGESQTPSRPLQQYNSGSATVTFNRAQIPQRIYAPAEVDLSLQFTLDRNKNAFIPVKFDNIKLQQGQTLDLGRIDFKPTLRIAVRLQTTEGHPVQGKRLTCKIADDHTYQTQPTNADGIVYINVPPNSKGELIFNYSSPFPSSSRPTIQWRIAGTEDQNKLLTFQLPEEKPIVFKGQVFNGITESLMPDMIVLAFKDGHSIDTSSLTDEDWKVLRTLKPPLTINDPSLAKPKAIFKAVDITKTDFSGRFQFAPSTNSLGQNLSAGVIGQNMIGTSWPLDNPSPDPQMAVFRRTGNIEVDQDGNVILPPLNIFPAAWITIQANAVEENLRDRPRIRCYPHVSDVETAPWTERLKKANLIRHYELQPNRPQSVCVPAGVTIDLDLYEARTRELIPIRLSGIKLQQGEAKDLGEVTFKRAIPVAVKLINSRGKPVPGVPVRVQRIWNNWLHIPTNFVTDSEGFGWTTVFPHAVAKFTVEHRQPTSDGGRLQQISETVEYTIGGIEDKNKEFIFELSDKMLELLSQKQNITNR